MEITPVEILEKILAYSFSPINRPQAPERMTLALVCHRWNAVVQEAPIIWSRISSRDTLFNVEKSLAKSNRHPIDVYGAWSARYEDLNEDTLAEARSFFELVNCHMGRWRHVMLELISDIPIGPSGGPAPLLESLVLYGRMNSPAVDELTTLFPRAWTPRLREVGIEDLELVQLDMPFPPTLTTLNITSDMSLTTSLSKLLTILMACPGLTALDLTSYRDGFMDCEGLSTFPVIELPALRELILCNVGKQVMRAILQRLHFPHQCVVRLSTSFLEESDPRANVNSTLAHHLDDLRNGGINQITFSIGFEFVVKAQGPRWNVEFALDTLHGARDVMLMFDHEGATGAEGLPHDRIPVTLQLSKYAPPDRMLDHLSSMSNFGRIASLKVDVFQDVLVTILSHLATKGVMPTWPLPGLRELHITGPMVEIDPVLQFVEKRRGNGDQLGTPARLQRIEFKEERVRRPRFSSVELTKRARPDSLLELLDILDEGAQVIWYGEHVHRG